jgi:hypothetical protein
MDTPPRHPPLLVSEETVTPPEKLLSTSQYHRLPQRQHRYELSTWRGGIYLSPFLSLTQKTHFPDYNSREAGGETEL